MLHHGSCQGNVPCQGSEVHRCHTPCVLDTDVSEGEIHQSKQIFSLSAAGGMLQVSSEACSEAMFQRHAFWQSFVIIRNFVKRPTVHFRGPSNFFAEALN